MTQVANKDWRSPPYNRWTFHHVREVVPCVTVWQGRRDGTEDLISSRDILDLRVSHGGVVRSIELVLKETFTDGLVILRNGKTIHSACYAGARPEMPHILFSATKSIVGLLTGALAGARMISIEKELSYYLPELSCSGYAGATVRHLLDMTTAVSFSVNYSVPTGDMLRYRDASGWGKEPARAIGLRNFLLGLRRDGVHGEGFRYCSPNLDLLAWVLERVTRTSFANLFAMMLCEPMGGWDDAYIAVDGKGVARAANGLCTTPRDLARLGQLILDGGAVGQKQIIPECWIQDIITGGDRGIWCRGVFNDYIPDAWYRSNWFKYGVPARAVGAMGAYGQALYVHQSKGCVFAKQSSQPKPLDFELESLQRAAFDAIALHIG